MADPDREIWEKVLLHLRAHEHEICRQWFDDIEPIGVTDTPSSPDPAPQPGRPEQQLAVLAVRLEMAAVYLRLVAGRR